MTLPGTGAITSAQIRNELGIASSTAFVIPDNVRVLTGVASGPIVWPTDFYSKKGLTLHAAGPGEFDGTNTETITIQANAQVGDIAVLHDCAVGTSSAVIPSGWTSLGGVVSGNIRVNNSYRILTSGQPGSTITGQNGSTRNRKIMTIIRPRLPIASVTPLGWTTRATTGTPTDITLGASGTPNMAILAFATGENNISLSASSAGTWTDAQINSPSVTRGYFVGVTKNNTPGDWTFSASDAGDANSLTAGILQFTFTV